MLRHAGTVESAALTHCPRLCFRSSTLKPQTSTTERTCRAASTVYMHSGTLADIVWSYNHSLVPCDRSAFHQVCDIFMRWTAQFVSRKASVGTRWVLIERSTSGGKMDAGAKQQSGGVVLVLEWLFVCPCSRLCDWPKHKPVQQHPYARILPQKHHFT